MTTYVSPKEAQAVIGVSTATLRRWAKAGKIDHIRTPGGMFRYNVASLGARSIDTLSIKLQPAPANDRMQSAKDNDRVQKPVSRPVEPPPAAVSIPQAPKPRMDQAALRRAFEGLARASAV